jgi:hypothetical protein
MDYTVIRKQSLRIFIAFLGLTALIAIVSVLRGDFGSFQVKILATCFTISAASIGSMACAAFIEKRKKPGLGLAGIFLSISAAVLVIVGIWPEIESDEYWKTVMTCVTFAVALAHAFLLALPTLDRKQQCVQVASSVSIGVLALLIVAALWGEIDGEGYFRLLAVVSILVGLETLVVPILMKLRKGDGPERQALHLESVGGDLYKDASGTVYRVQEVNQAAPQGYDA